jgi:hypothetical protein
MTTVEIPQRLRTKDFPLTFPRNPRSPRQLFYEDEKVNVRVNFPSIKYKELKDEVNRRWTQIRDKTPYMKLADLDKIRYGYELDIVMQNRDMTSPYRIFCSDFKEEVDKAFPHMSPNEKVLYINNLWDVAIPEVKELYKSLSDANIAGTLHPLGEPSLGEPSLGEPSLGEPSNPFAVLDEDFIWREPVSSRPQVPPHMVSLFMQTRPEDRECAICKEVIDSDMYMTPCYHLFHGFCVERCNKCPMCRTNL